MPRRIIYAIILPLYTGREGLDEAPNEISEAFHDFLYLAAIYAEVNIFILRRELRACREECADQNALLSNAVYLHIMLIIYAQCQVSRKTETRMTHFLSERAAPGAFSLDYA